ncbi:MAG: glycerophosphodiester phosphodiesterase family protein [Candidatus Alcyoniella australis]|nr:glycerophosphodiester phosphodiesterase family protein [Candidatus Alcyoniella australis]
MMRSLRLLTLLLIVTLLCLGCVEERSDGHGYQPPQSSDDDQGDDDLADDDDLVDDDDAVGPDAIPNAPYQCIPLYPDLRIVAHRGDTEYAPENTLPALEHAYQIGVIAAEIDLRHTADGYYVLMHDDDVDRTTNGSGRVDQMTLEQIRQLEVDDLFYGGRFPGLRVPTFEEALDLAQQYDKEIYIDTKTDQVQDAAQIVVDRNMQDMVFFYASSADKLARIRAVDSGLRIQPLSDGVARTLELIELFEPDPELFELTERSASIENIELIHSYGSLAHMDLLGVRDVLFVLGLEDAWLQPLQWGLDQVQTDHAAQLIEFNESLCQ